MAHDDRESSCTGQLGVTRPKVFPMSPGCMGISGTYGATGDNESIATIHSALDGGVILHDTGDSYGAGRNEMLFGRALNERRNRALRACLGNTHHSSDRARTRKQLSESLVAGCVKLSGSELAHIGESIPASAMRERGMDEHQMRMLGIERAS